MASVLLLVPILISIIKGILLRASINFGVGVSIGAMLMPVVAFALILLFAHVVILN
jgi:hypothetical protein